MQKEVGPIEEQEEQLLDAIARVLILVAKEAINNNEKTEGTTE